MVRRVWLRGLLHSFLVVSSAGMRENSVSPSTLLLPIPKEGEEALIYENIHSFKLGSLKY
jgi:hypothetical protein